jgi:hypothetical protein
LGLATFSQIQQKAEDKYLKEISMGQASQAISLPDLQVNQSVQSIPFFNRIEL